MSKIKRVFWTAAEEEQVFSQIPEVFTERWPTLIKRMQQVLPELRQKAFITSSSFTEAKHRYHKWLEEHPNFKRPKGTLLMVTQQEIDAKLAEAATTSDGPQIIIVERVVKEQPDYLSIPTSTLLRILGERIQLQEQFELRFRQMEDMIEAKRLAERTHDVRVGPLPPPPEKEKAIRIVIVGPLDSQAAEIQERCHSTPKPVKLRFYDKDSRNQDPMGIVDYAIVTRHCNHVWWDKMKAVLPNDRVFFVDSGIQSVTQKIYDICARRDS